MRAWLALLVGSAISTIAGAQVVPKHPRPFLIQGDSASNVSFNPTTGYTDTSSTTPNVTVTIIFGDRCQLPTPPGGPTQITLNGVDVSSRFTYAGGGGGVQCTGVSAQAVGTILLRVGTNADTLFASIINGGGQLGKGTAIYSYLPVYHVPPRHQLRITVAAGATHGAPSSRVSVPFTVTNIGNTIDTVYTKNHCNGAALSPPTHCFTSPDSAFGLPPGGTYSGTAFVDLGTTVGSTGRLETIAYERSRSGVTDTAYTDITVQNPLGPGVVLNTVTPDVTRPRDKCLTIEIRPGVAYECGDLRVAHALPAVRTYNKLHTQALAYNSNLAVGVYAIGALVTFDPSKGTPDTVKATITDSATGAILGQNSWLGRYWVNGGTQRVTVRANEIGNESMARWAYTFTATAIYNSAHTTQSYSATGAQISTSEGSGPAYLQMLAGQEFLVIPQWLGATPWNSTKPLYWQNSEGDTRQYNPVPGDSLVWASVGVDRPDTIKSFNGPTLFGLYRYAEHGTVVHFDAHGPEDDVTDRLGHATTLNMSQDGNHGASCPGAPNAYSVVLPTPSGGVPYLFCRGPGGSPLDSIVAPGPKGTPRIVHFHYDPLNLYADTIIDPDGSFVVYRFLNGQPHLAGYNLMLSYQDKRGTITTFSYDSAFKLIKAVVDTGTGHLNLTWTFQPAESRGYTTPVAPDSAYTLVTRPRANAGDSADVTRFWVDQWGEPTRIRDAHGYESEIARTNPTYPALATFIRTPNGRVETATYDSRGNDSTHTDSSTVVNGVAATTSYRFNHRWDFDTLTTLPAGEQTHDSLDAATGNRLWQQSGSDPVRRVRFAYGSYGLITSVTQPLSTPATITYDHRLGNDSTTTSPMGFTDSTYRDAIGRDTMDVTPNDSAQTQFTKAVSRYDIMDRVTDAIASAQLPAAESSFVHTHYAIDGLPDSVAKWASPDLATIDTVRTGTQYDALGRTVVQVAQDGRADTLHLDAAGNVVTHVTRRGLKITSTYDALNHLAQRVEPGVVYADTPRLPNCNGTDYCISADTSTFAYDAAGNQIAALNGDAWVYRHYNQNGTLGTDSLYTRTTAPLDSGGNFTTHIYGVGYTYDLDGRRLGLSYPTQLLSTSGKSLSYAYDPVIGLLDTITDVFGNKYSYTYDAAQRLQVTRYPGTITDSVTYDADSRVIIRIEQANYGSAPPQFPFGSPLNTDTAHYDARDKVTTRSLHEAIPDIIRNVYSGLGHTDTTHHTEPSNASFVEAWQWDALGHQVSHRTEQPVGHTMSNIQYLIEEYSYSYLAHTDRAISSPEEEIKTFCGLNGNACTGPVASSTTFDASGNASEQNTCGSSSEFNLPCYTTKSAYDASEQLRRQDVGGSFNPLGFGGSLFEETRYDALGRRVWRRTRSTALTTNDAVSGNIGYLGDSYEERYVWDGDQVLVEARSRGSDSIAVATLENDAESGSHFGVAAYVHGPKTDQPLAVQRFGYTPFAPFVEVIHYDHNNEADIGSFANGADMMCTSDQSVCVASGMKRTTLSTPPRGATQVLTLPPPFWNGELLTGQQNSSGHVYKRNRYYDPTTGQFTQEDPVGLAGGVNAYGFASGDPVNFVDPTGLDSRDLETELGEVQITGATPKPEPFSFKKLADAIKEGVKSTINGAAQELSLAVHHPTEALADLGKAAVHDLLDFGPKGFAAAAFPPSMRKFTGKGGLKEVTKNLAENHGVTPFETGDRLHAIKAANGIANDENLVFGLTGDVYTEAGELIGLLTTKVVP